jgi:sulfite exporter TauE/SafE
MRLLFVFAGALLMALGLAVQAVPAVRRLKDDVPDYAAAAA